MRHVTPVTDETAAASPITTNPSSRPAGVIVLRGTRDPAIYRLDRAVTVGRDAECDIVLNDPAASRVHARITREKSGALALIDLGSRNGVFVNGSPVGDSGRELTPGRCVIRLGDSILCITEFQSTGISHSSNSPLVGGGSLANARRQISLIAPTDLPVLLRGETGTGKEVAARMLHQTSGRAGAFVPVNCAALPQQLIESELFGHVKGSFTGATQAKKGLFSLASGGTLFLDEVGELPIELQPKLLRVLQEKLVRPVGSEREHAIDVRIISATHRSLADAKKFRPDLLGRLAGVEIRLPALRERLEDIPMLASFLLMRAGSLLSREGTTELDSNALEALMVYGWPLNVRELDNALRYASLRAGQNRARSICLDDLPEAVQATLRDARRSGGALDWPIGGESVSPPLPNLSQETHDETDHARLVPTVPPESLAKGTTASTIPSPSIDAAALRGALEQTRGNVRKASQYLGLSRAHMYRLLKQHDVIPAEFRRAGDKTRSVSPEDGTDVA